MAIGSTTADLLLSANGSQTNMTLDAAGVIALGQDTTIQTAGAGDGIAINANAVLALTSGSTTVVGAVGNIELSAQAVATKMILGPLGEITLDQSTTIQTQGGNTLLVVANGALTLESVNGDVTLQPDPSGGVIDCSSAEVTDIADGTATDSAAACGQFFSDLATFSVGQASIAFAVDAKFNAKPVQVTLATVPGGALAGAPIAFHGVVAAGSCTISLIDQATGGLVGGGAVTAFDVAVFITSAV
jgi:hypothetical protein